MSDETRITITVIWTLDDWVRDGADKWSRRWRASDTNVCVRAGEVRRDWRGYWWSAWGVLGGGGRGGPLESPEQARAAVDAYLKYLAELNQHATRR